MVDIFEHSARLDTAAVEEHRDLVQIIPDGGKLPCDSFDLVRVDIEHIRDIQKGSFLHLLPAGVKVHVLFLLLVRRLLLSLR